MPASNSTIRLGCLGVWLERRGDGSMIVRSTVPVPPHPAKMTERLEHWANVAPDRTFLAKREGGGDWRRITYAETLRAVRAIATALLERKLAPDRPIMLLSGNGIEHALLSLAAMTIGIPFAPISPAYALVSPDFGKLKDIAERLKPQLVFADDGVKFAKAITACFTPDVEVITASGAIPGHETTGMATLLGRTPDAAAVDAAHAKVGPDTIAKILFTSGSTGVPKGVITTQRMLTSNQAMTRHWLAFVADEPPVLLDWLPWNHTFGGNHNFGLVLYNGGSLFIDDGKPTPAGAAESLRNLREVAPSIYFNVPKGYADLVAALRQDKALREIVFAKLRLNFYSGASLPPHVSAELDRLAVETTGVAVPMVSGFGATETAPAVLGKTLATCGAGNIGLPLPGVAIKLVPSGDKLEARVLSPSLMPGYWRDPDTTAKAFDAEGYYRLGDAFRFARGDDPAGGFIFDGRITSDFKLSTGTWVSVDPLRARVIAALAPLIKDAVITGHDRSEIGALVVPDVAACRALLPPAERNRSDADILASEPVRDAFRTRLAQMARASTGSSTRIVGIVVLDEPPSSDAGEITEKGTINQRAVLTRRSSLVEDLHADRPSHRVLKAR